ncbi:hypothetical protein G6F59_017212 [Rhizopus arrhizus]|nr:hypothetical protein G6F59_017212 [Rhizopus arrhizus]
MLQALPACVTWPPAGAAQGRGRAIDDQRYSVATFVEDLQRRLHAAQRLPAALCTRQRGHHAAPQFAVAVVAPGQHPAPAVGHRQQADAALASRAPAADGGASTILQKRAAARPLQRQDFQRG